MPTPSTAAVRLLAGDKEPVRLATTANITLSGLQTIDGVLTVSGDRILVKDQSDATANGIYTASEGSWRRSPDAASNRTLIAGMKVSVQAGTAHGGDVWSLATDRPDIGTDNIAWEYWMNQADFQEATDAVSDLATAAAASASAAAASATAAANSASAVSTSVAKAISGLLPSNNATTPNTKLDFTAGTARDNNNLIDITLGAGVTKTTSAWVSGSGNGALDTGSVAINTCYHIFIIRNPTSSAVDILFSTSAVSPTMPSGYTQKRRIGAFRTDASGFILAGLWRADGSFEFATPITVTSGRSLGLASLLTLPVPIGVKMKARCFLTYENLVDAGNPAYFVIFRDPDLGAPTLGQQASQYKQAGFDGGLVETFTSTAGQVYTYSAGSTDTDNLVNVFLQGWTDLRDEYA